MMNATAPSARSVLWAAADTGGVAAFSMLGMLVMARFIAPSDFGLASLAIGIVQIMNLYVEGLLHDALIQRKDVSEKLFASAFWLVVCIGTVLFAIALLAALLLHSTPGGRLLVLLAAAASSLPFSAVVGVSNARLRRQFRYDTVAIPSVSAKVASCVLGVALAYKGLGAWSLVSQFVFAAAAQAVGLLTLSGWVPPFNTAFRPVAPLWRFAMPYAMMHTMVGARIQGFTGLIAATLGLSAAGFINVAFRLTITPQILLTTSLTNVGLPLLARHQDSPEARASAFDNFSRLVAAATTPAFFGLAACADRLAPAILGPQWTSTVEPMRIFAVGAAIYFLRLPSSLLLRSLGKVKYSFFNAAMHIAITLGGLALFRPHAAIGASLWWVAPIAPLIPLTLILVARNAEISIIRQLRSPVAPLVSASLMAAVVVYVDYFMGEANDLLALLACVAVGAVVYVAALLSLDGAIRSRAIDIVKTRLRH